jgi:Zn-dependent M28 family amino/carboxypeptidase
MPLLKRNVLAFFFIVLSCFQSVGQPDLSRVSVSAALLRKHVFLLASDSLQGRETGTVGQLQAGSYCTATFRSSHLSTVFRIDSSRFSFRQTYPFTVNEVANFGLRPYGTALSTYKRYELAALPLTDKASRGVLLGDNVAGLLVGTDLKQQVIVISAHYDHLGRSGRRIYHGADDNASGTATVLSIAAVFDSLVQQGIRPCRSILFVLFSGEEWGLLGSQYFINNSPVPLEQLACDLNVDMVGRVDDAHRKQPDYCYLITGNQVSNLESVAKAANEKSVKLALNERGYDVRNDPERYFYRSDHYNFAKYGIPALFFTGGHHPDYHQTTDTADKIRYEVLQKRATLVFQTAWAIANAAP